MKRIALLTLIAVFATAGLFAQEEATKKLKDKDKVREIDNGWHVESALGLDLKQLVFINPRASAGQNELGFGGMTSVGATYRKDKFVWDNYGEVQLGFTRFGKKENPFQKTTDVFRVATKPAYAITNDYKWYAAIEAAMETQLTPTYKVGDFTQISGTDDQLVSKFFAPAIITVSPGIEWKPDDHFSLLMSPASMRMLVVADDSLAAKGTLGNPWVSSTDYEKVDFQLGASAKASYTNKFWKDRVLFKTSLYLFYNYLGDNNAPNKNHPVVQWLTSLDVKIVDGLSVGVATALDYDFFQKVAKDDDGEFNDTGAQFRENLYIKYTKILTKKKE